MQLSGVHTVVHSHSGSSSLDSLQIPLSLSHPLVFISLFTLVSSYCTSVIARSSAIVNISSNICSTVCMWFLSPDFCKGDKVQYYIMAPFRSGGEKSVSGTPPTVSWCEGRCSKNRRLNLHLCWEMTIGSDWEVQCLLSLPHLMLVVC